MKYNLLKKTNLNISAIGLGTWVMGGDMWGGSKEKDCCDAIVAALDHGINFIDTAPIYGYGRSEEVVGRAIKGRRDKVVLATKCGLLWKGKKIEKSLKGESIKKEIDDSLRRLGVEYVDLYQCHWPDVKTPIGETMEILRKIQQQGKIRYIGVSNFGVDLMRQAEEFAEVVSLQSQYSILETDLENEDIPFCRDQGIGIIAYGAMGGGILSGKYDEPKKFPGGDARSFLYKYYQGEGFQKARQTIAVMKEVGNPLNQVALNWVRQKQGVTTVLAGCRNAQQVMDNVKAAEWELTDDQRQRISEFAF